jgi:hypothetical protein
VAVIANQLCVVAKTLIAARNELTFKATQDKNFAHPSVFVVNGLIASASTGLQAVTDAVASFCNHCAPDDEHTGFIYFDTFQFRVTEWDFISLIKTRNLSPLRFNNLSFNELANRLKHEMPWVGTISQNRDAFNDVYDDNGVGVLRGMLVPVYNQIKAIVQQLGAKFHQPVDLPFV